MRSHRSATRDVSLFGWMRGPLGTAIWCLATAALAYTAVLATFVLGYVMTGGVDVPPAPPALALPKLPDQVKAVLLMLGPCALAGGVVLMRSRWWVGIVCGIGLGALSGLVLYLSGNSRPEAPVFAPVGWVLAGYIGSVVGQSRRELRNRFASRSVDAAAGAEPGATPDRDA